MGADEELNNPYATPRAELERPPPQFEGEFEPLRTIWMRPRATVRRVVTENPGYLVPVLAGLAGIGQALDRASMRSAGDEVPLAAVLIGALVLGPVMGIIGLWIGAAVIRLVGKPLGGQGSVSNIATAVAWAAVPAVVSLPLWIVMIGLFGSDMFTTEMPRFDARPMLWVPFGVLVLIDLAFSIWGIVLVGHTVAEVQGYRSAWRGLGNILLAGAAIFAAIFALAFLALFIAKLSGA